MNKSSLKVKVKGEWLEELVRIYDELLSEYEPDNSHEWLLKETAASFGGRMKKVVEREQMNYTLLITSVEALAFYQLWSSKPMNVNNYGAVIINSVIEKIDQKHKHSKVLYAGLR